MKPTHPTQYAQAAKILRSARRVVIGGHPTMDGDALGSVLALAACLRQRGCKVLTVTQDLGPGKYSFLSGADQLKPLPKTLTGFDACIVVDCGAESRARAILDRLPASTPVVNLDHHIDNPGFGKAAVVLPNASSTGEVVWRTLKRAKLPLNKAAAEALFVAVVTDTGRFMFSNSSPLSYRIVAELVEKHGLNVGALTGHIYRSKTLGRMKLEGLVTQTLQSRMGGKLAVARVTREMLRETGGTDADANELVTIPNSLKGSMIALLFRELGPRDLKISFRSEGQMSVNQIAARFRGGGHKRASGAHVKGRPVAQVEREVIAAVEKELRATLKQTGGAIIA